jgi:hypothetical protein
MEYREVGNSVIRPPVIPEVKWFLFKFIHLKRFEKL